MNSIEYLVMAIAVLAVSACGGGNEPQATIKLYRYKHSLACVPESGISPDEMKQTLVAKGSPFVSFACGTDGSVVPADCGGRSGDIYILEIAESYKSEVEQIGFRPLTEKPQHKKVDCDTRIDMSQ
jgi:hypothetical protein